MTEPRGERSSVRYYCTAGNGMEPFLVQEVKTKLAAENVCQIPGKVLFSCSAGIHRVRELKAAERLFLLLRRDSPVTLPAHSGPAKAASVLQSRLLGDRSEWSSAVMTWSRLQRELAGRRTTVCTPSIAAGPTRKRTNREEEEEERGIERKEGEESGNGRQQWSNGQNETQASEKKRKGEEEENRVGRERGMERRREEERSGETCGDGESGTQASERKRKRDDGDEEEDERRDAVWESSREKQNGEKGETSERERKREEEEEDEEEERGVDAEFRGRGPGQHHSAERNCSKTGDADNVEHGIKVETAAGRDGTLREPGGDKPELSPPVPVSFRISCKCTGALSRRFSTQELSRVIGAGLSRLLGWKADLKNPQLEVNVYLSDDHCLIGMPLTRLPLANRSYIQTTGLRSTVAWALGSLAQIQPGSCVVDPMCGVGTILIEAAQEHKDACFLGMDIDDGQLQRANENVAFADLRNRIHLLKASSIELPLPSASVDAVVSDLPFGRKFGTKTHMAANLPLILTEMERVLRVGGILVLLLSPQLSCLLKKLQTHPGTGPTPPQDTEPQAGLPDCPSPPLSSIQQETFQSHPGIKSTSTQETEPRTGLQRGLPPPLSSLKHQATHRVSLGAIDGLIHKYVKTET